MTLSAEQLAKKNQEQKAKTMAEFEKEFSFAAKHRNKVGGYNKPVHDLWIGYCTGRVVGYTACLRDSEGVAKMGDAEFQRMAVAEGGEWKGCKFCGGFWSFGGHVTNCDVAKENCPHVVRLAENKPITGGG